VVQKTYSNLLPKVPLNFSVAVGSAGFFSTQELESARRFLRRALSKKFKVQQCSRAFFARTKKPAEVRMGKGKGKIDSKIALIRVGQVIFRCRGFLPLIVMQSVVGKLSKKLSKKLFVFSDRGAQSNLKDDFIKR